MKKVGNLVACCKSDHGKNIYVRIGTVFKSDRPNVSSDIVINLTTTPLPHMQWEGWCYIFTDEIVDEHTDKEEKRKDDFAPKPKKAKETKGDSRGNPF